MMVNTIPFFSFPRRTICSCQKIAPSSALYVAALLLLTLTGSAQCAETWSIVTGEALSEEEAIKVAVADVMEVGAANGLAFSWSKDGALAEGNVLLVGAPPRNRMTNDLVASGALEAADIEEEQGYAIQTIHQGGRRIMAVMGGSAIAEAYGLHWIWDRIRVHKGLPDLNVDRAPALKLRVGAAWGRRGHGGSTKEEMRQALRYSTNWVAGPAVLDLVPWNAGPERDTTASKREETRELIAYAHALHMKYFSFANEFTYHPSLLEEHGAELNACDPRTWDAVQAKFRMLFEALPELDGIELCNDDISGFWDNYRAYDLLHENPDCGWSYPKRFRTFVQKVREVVVDEFDKTYFHFTWGLTAHEQHVQPAVFREIFTEDVPTRGLYLMPKITAADRWWHQPYNATFNQTPHETIVCFETMNYYEGGRTHIFPTFSGQYFQAGLQTLLLPEKSNLRGAAFLAGLGKGGWDTRSVYGYVLYRLAWNPYEDMEAIARDFCAIHFGTEAAEGMAEIYLLSPSAYKYGLHIEPVSYGQFNSFIHMRVGTFPVEGYPTIDGGREHLDFLRKIYLRCKPWKTETLDGISHGLDVAAAMAEKFQRIKPAIPGPKRAEEIEQRLNMTRLMIATNRAYVRIIFAYFDHLDSPSEQRRNALAEAHEELLDTREAFVNAPGFSFRLFGVDQILSNARDALDDVARARTALEQAPTRTQLEETVAEQQRRYAEILEAHADEAVHFLHFEAMIDGRDILNLSGQKYSIDHLRWDGPHVKECRFLAPLPASAVTIVPKDLYSRPIHPFVLEQPTAENGFTGRIYLDDLPGGNDWVRCDLYYIPKPPSELGLSLPWRP